MVNNTRRVLVCLLAAWLLLVVVFVDVDASAAREEDVGYKEFPDICSFDWTAQITVNGTSDGTPFGPEPATEWSSYSRLLFRYLLPQHNTYNPSIMVGEGGVIPIEDTSQWYVYASYCCTDLPSIVSAELLCETWISCNILALGWNNDVCKEINAFNYNGTKNVNGIECDWYVFEGIGGDLFEEIFLDASSNDIVMFHWSSKLIPGVSFFEEWLTFDSFKRGSIPQSTFSIEAIHPSCYPTPTNACNAG
eukprot:TRINITY_DN5627_c0_g1_i1.p1 TRINITY_DN5627_c0_g1~~TRINITY_DN5627_c0_g1_i1.p1  ORF type:complete len:263 (-),score=56.44 TRINITY_DN5627_c0_g1_i1:92-838(-)